MTFRQWSLAASSSAAAEHERYPILAAYAHGTQRLHHLVDVPP
jgi:hypothetical protein